MSRGPEGGQWGGVQRGISVRHASGRNKAGTDWGVVAFAAEKATYENGSVGAIAYCSKEGQPVSAVRVAPSESQVSAPSKSQVSEELVAQLKAKLKHK
jgi:hypothetical protein